MIKHNSHIVIVIPARNEEAYISDTIRAISAQAYRPKSIVVADSVSTDRTSQLALELGAHVVNLNQKGVARARNAGGEKALELGADIIVFIDADTIMQPGLLFWIAEEIRRGKVAGTTSIALDKDHVRARITSFILNFLQRFHRSPHSIMFATGEVFRTVRFDEDMVMAEDEKWAYTVMKEFGFWKYVLITKTGVVTSCRRFEKYGYWNILYKWWTNLPFSLSDAQKEADYFKD